MKRFLAAVRSLLRRENGSTMVEYSLMLALIAVVCLASLTSVGTGSKTTFSRVSASL
jgi:pilus assembly protein Flp/PilA